MSIIGSAEAIKVKAAAALATTSSHAFGSSRNSTVRVLAPAGMPMTLTDFSRLQSRAVTDSANGSWHATPLLTMTRRSRAPLALWKHDPYGAGGPPSPKVPVVSSDGCIVGARRVVIHSTGIRAGELHRHGEHGSQLTCTALQHWCSRHRTLKAVDIAAPPNRMALMLKSAASGGPSASQSGPSARRLPA
jgi:hypothetical protein